MLQLNNLALMYPTGRLLLPSPMLLIPLARMASMLLMAAMNSSVAVQVSGPGLKNAWAGRILGYLLQVQLLQLG